MAAPRYYPPGVPRTDPLVRLYDIVYDLRDAAGGGNNAGNNTTNVTIVGGGGGGGFSAPEVVVGPHAARYGSNATLYIESDRQFAAYANNGFAWSAVDALWEGPFESRYAGLSAEDAGAYWTETSRNNITAVPPYLIHRWDGNNWYYYEGTISRNQSQLSALFATLGPTDAGMLINVLDYRHELQWQNNNTTTFGPHDDGRAGEGPIFREVDPSPATGWKLYDGSNNVTYLLANGNTGNINLPDLTSNNAVAAYPKGGTPNSGPNAAVAPTFSGNNFTPAGTVAANFSGNALTPTGNVVASFNGTPGTTAGASATVTVQVGVGIQVATDTHNHNFTPAGTIAANFSGNPITPTGTIAANFSGTPGAVTGSVSATGEPRNLIRRPWFRQ